ncbi:MAG: DUF29 domain-containing protein [Pseudomonadota bacterium]|nr:DUF29 domain-containing protein [Pseudomonadota bacterium]
MKTKTFDYHKDFYAWALHNAQLLRQGKFADLDVEHIAEELETIGKNNKRELASRFKILLAHLLKWQYQADYRGRSWRSSIVEQRSEMNDDESIAYAYPKAVKFAVKETGLSPQTFPQSCPYSLEQILDEDFYPEGNNFDEYSENR